MIVLPPSLKRYQKDAKEALAKGLARDIEFSGGTYQVLVVDPHTGNEEWAFLQLDNQGRLKDSFCSCKQSENGRACMHQAAAFLRIYGEFPFPLHQRLEKSLWGSLCRSCSDMMGTRPDQLKATKDGRYICRGPKGREIFSIEGKTQQAKGRLEKLLFQRPEETEETSLKFSNLSESELEQWQQGKPTPQLMYELSCWSDVAKWLNELQEENKPYSIEIDYSAKKIPNALTVSFPTVKAKWMLFEDAMPSIIPALSSVKSPLEVRTESTEGIEKIIYDKEKRHFVIVEKKRKKDFHSDLKSKQGVDFGDWRYVPGEGFYSKRACFLKSAEDLDDVEAFLNEHAHAIKELISGVVVREVPVTVSYSLSFDSDWNLHIQSYIFAPGDLSLKGSQAFGSWVYIEGRGFYRWEGRYFDEIETVVPADGVADFVSQHRTWLNMQEGFHTHLNALSSDLIYRVTEDNYLVFSRNLSYQEDAGVTKDFGRYIYIEGQGFFSKAAVESSLPLRAGASIPPDQVPYFIDMNKEELQLTKGFFSGCSPVAKAELSVDVDGDDRIVVTPHYHLHPEYQPSQVKFFDDYSYVEGEGFFPLKGVIGLPEKYRHPVIIEGEALVPFIQEEMRILEPFIGTVDKRLKKAFKTSLVAEKIDVGESEGNLNYTLKLDYQSELGTLSLASIWGALQKNQRYIFSAEGLIDLSDRRYGWLKNVTKKKIDRRRNTLTLSTLELLRLNAVDEISVQPGKDAAAKHSRDVLRDITEFRTPQDPDLKGLKSLLRPYQQLGVKWLWFLYHHGLSGLLCDDMGLGKTHQAMALMAAVSNSYRQKGDTKKRHFLVVCPTSVIYHWQEKLAQFLPGLKVWTFYGTNRTLESFHEDYDILLTSYGIWRNETEQLETIPFEVAVFDELQIAKNQTSRIYNALLRANARMRLGMTGTPIENRLRELKSLFDIVLPFYMPPEHEYREQYIRPIEKEGNMERKQVLARLVRPFVMRRKKEDVLIDLPEKIEEVSHCDLLPEQHKMYVEVLSSQRDKLIEELKDESTPVPYMHIFALLSHLKQICNHPACYLKSPADYKKYQSGKWELFLELLQEARESGQKVVVFSHFLSMLDIIEDYLKEHGIGFAAIRGATVNRGEQLNKFNKDPQCQVFVASLQAAGLGVDLTAGSVVIHYDRWWNAARENQATDRVHRIGQTRGVQVFKLMTKGTLEEHIDFLISKKGKLMEDVVSVDDHQTIKKFDRQEIIRLLQVT